MKVGVITFHSAFNFGASLQTFALQEALKKIGVTPCVINYRPEVIDGLYDPYKTKDSSERAAKRRELMKTAPYKVKKYERYSKYIEDTFELYGEYHTYEDLLNGEFDFDAVITGSDQVWNPMHTGGYNKAYFLEFVPEGIRKISYAASIGTDKIPESMKEKVKKALASFDAISVRESSAVEEIKGLTDKEVNVVLDPTFLLTKKEYDKIKIPKPMPEKYILVYMMEKNDEVISFANRISRSLGIPIVQRRPKPLFLNELDNFHTAIPGEFISLIENAELVITNSFHGTVFSALYEKDFISMLNTTTGSRTVDLLKALGLERHLLYHKSEFDDFKQYRFTKEDKEISAARIKELRYQSMDYLIRSLEIGDGNRKVSCPTDILRRDCYGCRACEAVCPQEAISMQEDEAGFIYPVVNQEKCTGCGICSKNCIRKINVIPKKPVAFPKAFGMRNKDESLRMQSSSGAVFPALARHYIEDLKGYVVGVQYDENMKAVMTIAKTMEEVRKFFGSKYVKSDTAGIYTKVKELLKKGEYVLFTGLPCECAGLRAFLGFPYERLLICEIMCHAGPSPKVFEEYVKSLEDKYGKRIININFRDKSTGWRTNACSIAITFEDGTDEKIPAKNNPYFKAFLNDYIIRESCMNCEYVYDKRLGDITIGDFWGVDEAMPQMNDDKGTSMCILNTVAGEQGFHAVESEFEVIETTMEEAFVKNHKTPVPRKTERFEVMGQLGTQPVETLLKKYNKIKQKKTVTKQKEMN